MAGPWEQYAGASSEGKPWENYALPVAEAKPERSFLGETAANVGNLAAGAVRGAGSIGATLARPFETGAENKERRLRLDENARNLLGADPESAMYGVGKFGGEVAGTLGAGGVLASGAKVLGAVPKIASALPAGAVQKVVEALRTWGMSTGAAPVGIAQRAADLGVRAGAGAATGGAAGALIDPEHAPLSAGMGAGAAVVLPTALSLTSKAAGKVYDALTGRWGKVKAGDIMRRAAGGDLAAIKAASAVAPGDLTATQATGGVRRDTYDALGDIVAKSDKDSYFSRLAAQQKDDQIEAIAKIAGGRTQTEALTAAKEGRKALSAEVGPKMQIELGAANTGGTVGRRLQSEQEMLADAVTNKVADVRRLSKAGQIAEDTGYSGARGRLGADSSMTAAGMPRTGGQYTYGKELSDLAERITSGAADDSLILGQAARFKQAQLDSLAAHGLKPIDTNRLVSGIRSKLNDPSIAGNGTAENVLGNVAKTIKIWTDKAGGVIDAEALHSIRKFAVNSELEKLGVLDPKLKQEMASGVLLHLKPLIDDAIESAGGTGWRAALKEFEQGAHLLDQQKMGAKALDLLKTSPRSFEKLVGGDKPERVQKIFQTEFDISKAMGPKFGAMKNVSDALTRDRLIKEGASRGQGGMKSIIDENTLGFVLPNWINASIAVMNRGLKATETGVNAATLRNLQAGMKTGKSANELLNTLPTEQRLKVIEALLPYTTAAGISATQGGAQ